MNFSAALHWWITVRFLSGRASLSEMSIHVRAYFTPHLETDVQSKDFYVLHGHLPLSLEKKSPVYLETGIQK